MRKSIPSALSTSTMHHNWTTSGDMCCMGTDHGQEKPNYDGSVYWIMTNSLHFVSITFVGLCNAAPHIQQPLSTYYLCTCHLAKQELSSQYLSGSCESRAKQCERSEERKVYLQWPTYTNTGQGLGESYYNIQINGGAPSTTTTHSSTCGPRNHH